MHRCERRLLGLREDHDDPDISPGIATIQGGLLRVEWALENTCAIRGCLVSYDIQIDRLAP